ncbi:MAG TPA: RND transporter [Pirellulales bacterium]|jgi:cobalt-zinc-cadmium efflux system membrane fusion protein|nr:RND transporter [Pirellulales bacterium]
MNAVQKTSLFAAMLLAMLMVAGSIGCGQSGSKVPAAAISSGHAHTHSHDNWWCDEHGVPEEVCGQCNPKLAAEFQKKGDWCQEHDRPDSQCFICHPEQEAKFAAKYEAKFGKKPPQPEG